MSDLSGGGLGTTLRISIWRDFFCGNVPVFIPVHVADGIGYTLQTSFTIPGLRITGEMWP